LVYLEKKLGAACDFLMFLKSGHRAKCHLLHPIITFTTFASRLTHYRPTLDGPLIRDSLIFTGTFRAFALRIAIYRRVSLSQCQHFLGKILRIRRLNRMADFAFFHQ
jgi:hypothetical protein